jgi:hypothetical protein
MCYMFVYADDMLRCRSTGPKVYILWICLAQLNFFLENSFMSDFLDEAELF